MKLISHNFQGQRLPRSGARAVGGLRFRLHRANRSPHLRWEEAPADTKSFALTGFAPRRPPGSGFWHWVVVNIPPGVNELALDSGNASADELPAGALQARTDFGTSGYAGPCPPAAARSSPQVPLQCACSVYAVRAVSMDKLPVTADTSAAVVGSI